MLSYQKKMAASIKRCSIKRVKLDPEALSEIKEAITKEDIRKLIKNGIILILPVRGISRSRAKVRAAQRRKGRQKGPGRWKGKSTARLSRKTKWVNKIRLQRKHLVLLREKKQIANTTYRDLFRKAKGGYFRSRRHLNLYIEEQSLLTKK